MRANGQQAHVVVIDHTHEIGLLFEELLRSESYRATVLGDCPESVDQIVALRPDVIVHDYALSHAEADRVSLRRLTTDPRTSHIPLVLCSAATDVDDIAARLGGASVQVIAKPFTIDEVLGAIRSGARAHLPGITREVPPLQAPGASCH
ncbi:MAG TPA: response regulator [Thermomicrobiales bacterium]|nr:response regulator [Thermomicrobiales bacterium]